MKRLLLLAIFLTACPEQQGDQCPAATTSLGQFTLHLSGQHPAGECKVGQSDGGVNPLVLEDGGSRSGTFCYGIASDGGAQIQLVVPKNGTRTTALLADGGFAFVVPSNPTTNPPVTGTLCDATDGGTCAIAIDETFAGYLYVGPDAGFALLPDGGVPIVTTVTGSLVDSLSSADTTHCVCNVPCTVTYGINGTRF